MESPDRIGLLVIQVLIACVWLTTDFLMARIGWARFGMAIIVLLTISGTWVYVFAQMWGRSKAILDSTPRMGRTSINHATTTEKRTSFDVTPYLKTSRLRRT